MNKGADTIAGLVDGLFVETGLRGARPQQTFHVRLLAVLEIKFFGV